MPVDRPKFGADGELNTQLGSVKGKIKKLNRELERLRNDPTRIGPTVEN